jgi:hypothetical protein
MKERGRFLPLTVIISLIPAVILASALSCEGAYADGNSSAPQPRYRRPTTRQYNDRLPPVMPGEEIVTETGQKMKTWSSSGPVPVNRRPPPQAVGNGAGLGGVIVDTRDHYGQPIAGGGGGVQPLAPRGR